MKKIIFISILLIVLCSSNSFSQAGFGTMKILVLDKITGTPFINDTIIITTNDTVKDILVSDNEGYMRLQKMPGAYRVRVARKNYNTTEMSGIRVSENNTIYITIELDLVDPPTKNKRKKKGGVRLKMK